MNISAPEVAVLKSLIERLETAVPIPRDEALRISKAHRRKTIRQMGQSGNSWTAASGDLPHFAGPDPQGHLKSIQGDFGAQVSIFAECVDAWFDHCTHPAPGYTWRITVMLRKAKLFDLERRFLSAYFKHLYTERGSARDRDLGIRAIKIGIDIPAPPDSSMPPLAPNPHNRPD